MYRYLVSSVGRPAGPAQATTSVVLTAALDLLLTEGFHALTPQRLHQATGVSRSTIYRHWESPTHVLAALVDVAPNEAHPSSGSPAQDVHAEIDLLCDRLRSKPVGAFLQALLAAGSSDPTALALRQQYVEDLMSPFRRGFLAAGLGTEAADEAVLAVVSPLLVDALLLDRSGGRRRAHRMADLYLADPARG